MPNFKHKCLKCQADYEDKDPDPYFCAPCIEVRKQIALEIDAKLDTASREPVKSDLQAFDELRQSKGIRGFVNIKDLGIKL